MDQDTKDRVKEFIEFLIHENPKTVDVLDDLVIKIGLYSKNNNLIASSGLFRNRFTHGFPKSYDTDRDNWIHVSMTTHRGLKTLAHEFRHFMQRVFEDELYHEGDSEIFAKNMVKKFKNMN